MRGRIFLEYLPWLRRPRYLCNLSKRDHAYMRTKLSATTPEARTGEFDASELPAALLELFEEHDLSNLNILGTSFLSAPFLVREGWQLARMDSMRIVLCLTTQRVLGCPVLNRIGPPTMNSSMPVARDLGAYLEALLAGDMMRTHFIFGAAEQAGPRARLHYLAHLCAVIAGGEEYFAIWEQMVREV